MLGHAIPVPPSGTLNTFRATQSHDVAPRLLSVPPDTPTEGAVGTLCLSRGPWLCKEMFLSKALAQCSWPCRDVCSSWAGELCSTAPDL